MAGEFWGTLSIYDHRQPYFRPSLLLFDKIVVPVPTRPWKDVGQEELDRLAADVSWLQEHGAAIECRWDPMAFDTWVRDHLSVINAVTPDRQTHTRYHVKYLIDQNQLDDVVVPPDVVAVPVFASRQAYAELEQESLDASRAAQATLEVILPTLPLAASDAPLEDIIRLRERGFVEHQVRKLRQWQAELVDDLVAARDDPKRQKARLDRAEADLKAALSDYRQAMANMADARVSSLLTTLFAIANPLNFVQRVFVEHRGEFSVAGRDEKSWKALFEKPYAFAGILCTAEAVAGG